VTSAAWRQQQTRRAGMAHGGSIRQAARRSNARKMAKRNEKAYCCSLCSIIAVCVMLKKMTYRKKSSEEAYGY